MSENRTMIRCDKLTKRYGSTLAIDQISFEMHTGEILGFLGPNGAGKSTTMKILTSFLAPTSGSAHVAGFDVSDDSLKARARIGYLPEDTPLYRDMRVIEYLDYVTELRRIPRADRRARIKKIGETTGILDVLGKRIGTLSKGYRQRVGLTQAMVHDPDVLILDEPTSGLDPNQIVQIRGLIQELGRKKTVVLSTHILPEVQATCDRVIIVSDGRVVADGKPKELVAQQTSDKYRLLLETSDNTDAISEKLKAIEGVKTVKVEPAAGGGQQYLIGGVAGKDLRRALFECAVAQTWPVLELERKQVSLEEVFGRLTRTDDARESSAAKPAQEAA